MQMCITARREMLFKKKKNREYPELEIASRAQDRCWARAGTDREHREKRRGRRIKKTRMKWERPAGHPTRADLKSQLGPPFVTHQERTFKRQQEDGQLLRMETQPRRSKSDPADLCGLSSPCKRMPHLVNHGTHVPSPYNKSWIISDIALVNPSLGQNSNHQSFTEEKNAEYNNIYRRDFSANLFYQVNGSK